MKSDSAKKGIERAPHRSLFKAMGYTDAEIKKPLIGIANSANSIIPGHINLDKITDEQVMVLKLISYSMAQKVFLLLK